MGSNVSYRIKDDLFWEISDRVETSDDYTPGDFCPFCLIGWLPDNLISNPKRIIETIQFSKTTQEIS